MSATTIVLRWSTNAAAPQKEAMNLYVGGGGGRTVRRARWSVNTFTRHVQRTTVQRTENHENGRITVVRQANVYNRSTIRWREGAWRYMITEENNANAENTLYAHHVNDNRQQNATRASQRNNASTTSPGKQSVSLLTSDNMVRTTVVTPCGANAVVLACPPVLNASCRHQNR